MKPIFISGKVTKGFQRGSKLLGYPTANLPAENFEKELEGLSTGVYFGWASVRSNVYKTVLSIGYNPHFNNQKKTIEPYLIHEFDSDFYDEELRLCITGYIRGEKKFNSLGFLFVTKTN
eukprot:gene8365-190_t